MKHTLTEKEITNSLITNGDYRKDLYERMKNGNPLGKHVDMYENQSAQDNQNNQNTNDSDKTSDVKEFDSLIKDAISSSRLRSAISELFNNDYSDVNSWKIATFMDLLVDGVVSKSLENKGVELGLNVNTEIQKISDIAKSVR